MNLPLTILIVLLGVLFSGAAFARLRFEKRLHVLRMHGIYPKNGRESEADIARLKKAGETVLAVRCYRALHRVGLKEAHDAVMGRDAFKEERNWPLIACFVVIVIAVFATVR